MDLIITQESKIKISKTRGNKTGYFRVSKIKCDNCKKGYTYQYCYYDENKNRKAIKSVSFDGLRKKVLDKGLEWQKLKEV